MPRIAVPVVVLALGASVALAACGGGGSDSKPTKAQYIAKADGICKAADAKIQADAQKKFGNNQPTPAQVTDFQKNEVLPALEKERDDLKALDKPKGDDAQLNALYDSLDKSIQKAKSSPTISGTTFADANRRANAYGLKQCGSSN